jgi:hypothetical protein
MRGDDDQQEGMFSYISPEKRVPADHPLRPIRKIVDEILKEMSPKFQKLYRGWTMNFHPRGSHSKSAAKRWWDKPPIAAPPSTLAMCVANWRRI